jgi:AcrR family transcriptional regulator
MDEIASATAVTKRTLYNHFQSKDQLLAAVLEAQNELASASFRTFGDQLTGSPVAIVDGLFRDLAVWSDKPRWAGSGFTRLVIELADLPGHPARAIARRHKALLESHLGDLLKRAGVKEAYRRAREIWLLSEGAISLMLVARSGFSAEIRAPSRTQLMGSRTSNLSVCGLPRSFETPLRGSSG